jgi:hypothetical protein
VPHREESSGFNARLTAILTRNDGVDQYIVENQLYVDKQTNKQTNDGQAR